MQLTKFFIFLFASLFVPIQAKTRCAPALQSTPRLQFDFSVAINFGPTIDIGTNIYSADESYLPSTGGTFCAKWNGGTTGTILTGGTALFYHTLNSTGPYKLSIQYLLVTNDVPPAHILVKEKGFEVSKVGRTYFILETGDKRYFYLNSQIWTGVETGYTANATGTFSTVDAYLVV